MVPENFDGMLNDVDSFASCALLTLMMRKKLRLAVNKLD